MKVEIELVKTVIKTQIEFDYFNQRNNYCLDKLIMKTVIRAQRDN